MKHRLVTGREKERDQSTLPAADQQHSKKLPLPPPHSPSVPPEIRDYVESLQHPAGLIGCRALGRGHPCCEYDIAVLSGDDDNGGGGSGGSNAPREENCYRLAKVGSHFVELVHIARPDEHAVALAEMVPVDKAGGLLVTSIAGEAARRRGRFLAAQGRRSLASSLVCQQRMKSAAAKNQAVVSAMWLKMAAYHYIQGALALAGQRPMPLHELAQARQADLPASAADELSTALDCIGIERATRTAIARSQEAVAELKSQDPDRELVASKAGYLLEKSMLADCYYYLGRVAAESLAGRGTAFYSKYAKLVQLAMDLPSDSHRLEKLQLALHRAAKKGL